MTNDDWTGKGKLRGIKAKPGDGNGHNFKKSGVNKLAKTGTKKAPQAIYDANMKTEKPE